MNMKILEKNCNEITNKDFEVLAKEIKKINTLRNTENRGFTHDEELFVKAANGKLYEKMDMYIHSFLHKTYPTFNGQIYEDLYSICITEMFTRFPDYTSNIALSTFFVRWFKGACNEEIGKTAGMTRYYNNKANIINRAIAQLKNKGILQYTVSDIKLQLEQNGEENISNQTIKNVLKMNNMKKEELTEELDKDKNNIFPSPEEKILQDERNEMLNDILSSLYPAERIAYLLANGYFTEETGYVPTKNKLTLKQISIYPYFLEALLDYVKMNQLKVDGNEQIFSKGESPEYQKQKDDIKQFFTNKLYCRPEVVGAVLSRAKNKIKSHPLVIQNYDKSNKDKLNLSENSETDLEKKMTEIDY